MRTSLNKIARIENYLHNNLPQEDKLLFDAGLILDETLKPEVVLQQKVYGLVHIYGRNTLRKELEELSTQLSADPAHQRFWSRIIEIFKV